jgi:hypothetical protein
VCVRWTDRLSHEQATTIFFACHGQNWAMTYLTKAMALVEWALTSGLTENCLPACSPLDAKFELDVCEVNKVMFC